MPRIRPEKIVANILREWLSSGESDAFISFLVLLFFEVSVPVSIVAFNLVMDIGHHTTFSPDEPRQGYTEGPNSRGTINIIWACLSTIFTCAYISLHLDVPNFERVPEGCKAWLFFYRKVEWCVMNIVVPELILYNAVVQFMHARKWKKIVVEEFGIDDGVWTLEHQFFADMGGFKVSVIMEEPSKEAGSTPEQELEVGHLQNINAEVFEPRMETGSTHDGAEGRRLEEGRNEEPKKIRGSDPDVVILRSGHDFYNWLDRNPSAIDSINFKQAAIDIRDRSKADWLLKSLAIIQASWLVVQTIARAIEGQPVSELEVTTCAYVLCAIFTYGFWWYKPYGVEKHVLLHVDPTSAPRYQDTEPTPFSRNGGESSLELTAVILSGCVGAAIGAIHCTLWHAEFVNTNGQLLWRICCIAQIVAPIVMSAFLAWRELCDGSKTRDSLLAAAFVACFMQFCARIVIFTLIGYSFRSLPAGVYREVDWTWSWLPHIH